MAETPAEELARVFHTEYDKLYPAAFGYEKDLVTPNPWAEAPPERQKLLIHTFETLISMGVIVTADTKTASLTEAEIEINNLTPDFIRRMVEAITVLEIAQEMLLRAMTVTPLIKGEADVMTSMQLALNTTGQLRKGHTNVLNAAVGRIVTHKGGATT